MVTHPSTNRARRWATPLIKANALSLSQTDTKLKAWTYNMLVTANVREEHSYYIFRKKIVGTPFLLYTAHLSLSRETTVSQNIQSQWRGPWRCHQILPARVMPNKQRFRTAAVYLISPVISLTASTCVHVAPTHVDMCINLWKHLDRGAVGRNKLARLLTDMIIQRAVWRWHHASQREADLATAINVYKL